MPIQTTSVGWEKGRSDTRRNHGRVKSGSAATSRANASANANHKAIANGNGNGNTRASTRTSTGNRRRNGIGAASNHRLPVKAVAVAGSQRPPQKPKPASAPTRKPSWTSETELASCLDKLVLDSTRHRPRPRSRPSSNGSDRDSARLHPRSSRSAPAQSPDPNRRQGPAVSPGGTLARQRTHPHPHPHPHTVPARVRAHLVAWTETVFASIGPGRRERVYQLALRDLLLRQGLDVAIEVPLTFQRMAPPKESSGSKNKNNGSSSSSSSNRIHIDNTKNKNNNNNNESKAGAVAVTTVSKRADVIVSMQGNPERVLIECKAKPRITRDDWKQVLWYQHHFGIRDCYLVNFCGRTKDDVQVHKLRE